MTAAYLTRPDAADYLSGKLGRRVTVGALHRHASDGTGPDYVMILGRASYQAASLDAWVERQVKAPATRVSLTPPARSASDAAPVAA